MPISERLELSISIEKVFNSEQYWNAFEPIDFVLFDKMKDVNPVCEKASSSIFWIEEWIVICSIDLHP